MTRRPTRERLWSILHWMSEQSADAADDVRAEIDALTAERDGAREALRREMMRVEECERDMHQAWKERDEAITGYRAARAAGE